MSSTAARLSGRAARMGGTGCYTLLPGPAVLLAPWPVWPTDCEPKIIGIPVRDLSSVRSVKSENKKF